MIRHAQDLIEKFLDIKTKNEYLFHELCGLTFVFKRHTTFLNSQITSGEIYPLGIIYEENGQYYYAPLYDEDEIDKIVSEYVKIFSEEEEYPHF